MKRYGHGLVLGRFCPPHSGHHRLVALARERCERLTVLVRASAADPVPLDDRVAWMRETHPGVLVVGAVDDLPAGPRDPGAWAARTAVLRAAVPERVDALFDADTDGDTDTDTDTDADTCGDSGGGTPGEEFARRLGAAPVRVAPDPLRPPVSDAAVRADPVGCWDRLAPPVRAALTRRVVVLGAESTGTTTMARALADHYRGRGGVWARTRYVADYGHEYRALGLAGLRAERPDARWSDVPLRSADFPVIAQRQTEREEEAARDGSPVLFCDTDAFAATIWHERYVGVAGPAVGEIAARGRRHLWLLTDHRGVAPVGSDGPGPDDGHLRPWMTARFLTQLTRTGRRTAVLTGPHEERLAAAVAAVDALLAEGWGLTDPPPERR